MTRISGMVRAVKIGRAGETRMDFKGVKVGTGIREAREVAPGKGGKGTREAREASGTGETKASSMMDRTHNPL